MDTATQITNPKTKEAQFPSLSDIPSRILSMSLKVEEFITSFALVPLKSCFLLCYPGCKVHIRTLVIPGHLLADDRLEEANANPSNLPQCDLIENINENQVCDHLKGTHYHQPDQIGQGVVLDGTDELFARGILTEIN